MSTLTVGTIQSNTTSPPVVENSAGTQIGTFCRAWVNFNGTGTVAIRAAFNCSSVTDNGTCSYTINFTVAMPDENYATVASMQSTFTGSVAFSSTMSITPSGTYSTAGVSVVGVAAGDVSSYAGQSVTDSAIVCVAIFR